MDEKQIRIIRALQDGLPLSLEPYKEIAERAGVTEDELLRQIRAWQDDGTIRRFGAILRHHQAGFAVNAMGAWNVPQDRIDDFTQAAGSIAAVSHMYQRPRFEGFDYDLYTMIHGRSREECEETARRISERTGITDYALLYTTAEFKKSSPVYFADDTETT